jgi:hypothetical protein
MLVQPQKHFLARILGVRHITQHPVGDAEYCPLMPAEDLFKVAGIAGSVESVSSGIQCGLASIHVTNIYEMAGRNVETGSDRLS